MATIERRTAKDGQTVFRVKVRRQGHPAQTATFPTITQAKKWAQVREGAVLEGRYFGRTSDTKHTLADAIERYLVEVMPSGMPEDVRGADLVSQVVAGAAG